MKHNSLEHRMLGISIVLKFYICLILLYALPLFVYSTKLLFFGIKLPQLMSNLIHVGLVLFLYFLYVAIKRRRQASFFFALAFHSAFFLNGLFMLLGKPAFLIVENSYEGSLVLHPLAVWTSMVINMWIIYCITVAKYRSYFVDNI